MTRSASITEVKTHFSDWVRSAEAGESIIITRHRKPVVAMVPTEELRHLAWLRAEGPARGLASLAGGWQGAEDLLEQLMAIRRSRPR